MNTTQHDRADDTSRPADPAVVAAAAGKTTPERSGEKQHQHQPSQQHNRGPPLDEPQVERFAGDLLVGADAIRVFLAHLGMPEDTDVYYLKRAGRWPIGSTNGGGRKGGGKLIASKRRLIRHVEEITRGGPAASPPKRHARSDQPELPAE
jgi:hypothetical protein